MAKKWFFKGCALGRPKWVMAVTLCIIPGAWWGSWAQPAWSQNTTLAPALESGAIAQTPRPAAGRFSTVRNPEQVPTARYGRGEAVDLLLIIDEWRDRFPQTAVFVCTCTADACGDRTVWPFRAYTRYQPFVALGPVNAAAYEATQFKCFDMETGASPS